jgi:hypothetical protein
MPCIAKRRRFWVHANQSDCLLNGLLKADCRSATSRTIPDESSGVFRRSGGVNQHLEHGVSSRVDRGLAASLRARAGMLRIQYRTPRTGGRFPRTKRHRPKRGRGALKLKTITPQAPDVRLRVEPSPTQEFVVCLGSLVPPTVGFNALTAARRLSR